MELSDLIQDSMKLRKWTQPPHGAHFRCMACSVESGEAASDLGPRVTQLVGVLFVLFPAFPLGGDETPVPGPATGSRGTTAPSTPVGLLLRPSE